MKSLVIPGSLPVALSDEIARWHESARGAFSSETERAWRQDSANFADYCSTIGVSSLPATPETVAAYARSAAAGKAVATVQRRIASVARMHKAAGLADPTKTEEVRNAVRAIKRERGTQQKHAGPLRLRDADRMVDRAAHRASDRKRALHPRELRDIAMIRVGHAMLTRANELASITVESIRYQEDGTARIDLLRRKTSDSVEPTFLNEEAADAMRAWLAAAGITSGYVFVRVSSAGKPGAKPLDRKSISRTLKTMAKRGGIDPQSISSHSMRRGCAQDLMDNGADIGSIAQAGGWKTTVMPLRYTKDLAAGQGAVAKFFKGKGR